MDALARALKEVGTCPAGAQILHYLETGDKADLVQISAAKQQRYGLGYALQSALSRPDALTDTDRRILDVLVVAGLTSTVVRWVEHWLDTEKEGEDLHAILRRELTARKVPDRDVAELSVTEMMRYERDGVLNSAGRYLAALPDALVTHVSSKLRRDWELRTLLALLTEHAPQRIPLIMKDVLRSKDPGLFRLVLTKGGASYEPLVVEVFQKEKDLEEKFWIGSALAAFSREKYFAETLGLARALLKDSARAADHASIAEWMIENLGADALPDISACLEQPGERRHRVRVLNVVVEKLGAAGKAAIHAAARNPDAEMKAEAVTVLLTMNEGGAEDADIEAALHAGLTTAESKDLVRLVGLVCRWKVGPLADDVWRLLENKSRPVREAAVRALLGLGEAVLPRAVPLLQHRKADCRIAAVQLLAGIGTAPAQAAIEARLETEADDNVRDTVFLALETAAQASGCTVSRAEVEKRITRAQAKLTKPVADWLSESTLPPLRYSDGGPLSAEAARYLLYRQSRVKEMRADIEAKPLYALLDRASSGDFALTVLKAFLASPQSADDRWAMTLAGLLGDDRVVPTLLPRIAEWADAARGKLAEYAVTALALLGSDAALCSVDAMAIRYRTKNKNIGKAAVDAFAAAAEARGLTPDELGDRVVPWLGFEPGKPRMLETPKGTFEVLIGPDLKLTFRDVTKNKRATTVPGAVSAEVKAEMKELAATLKEVVKGQLLRMENLMVRQYRWPAARWAELFLQHPMLLPFAQRLVWGMYGSDGKLLATARALEDRTLVDINDDTVPLPQAGSFGIVHPLELEESVRQAWQAHLADYDIETPFPQMERAIVFPKPEQRAQKYWTDVEGTSINAMTFKGRAEKRGWTRGSVCDGGGIMAYTKSFPAAKVDVFLGLEDMYIGIDMYSNITLEKAFFVRHGSVKTGSYTYDDPANEADARLVPLGDVPAIAYSEAIGDLQKIAGRTDTEAPEA